MTVILILLRQVIYCAALFTTIGHSVDGAPQSFQPESDLRVCVGDPVTFTCTVVDDPPLSEVTVWRASGGVECQSALVHAGSLTGTCPDAGSSTEFMVNGTVQGMDCVEIEFTAAMATVDMDNTLIECHNGSALNPSTLVGSSRLLVEGDPPSAPTNVNFTMDGSDPQRAFVVQWSGTTVGNGADIGGYNVDISGPDDGCGERGVAQFTAVEQYRCPMPSVSGMYTFSVSAVCGTLEGTAVEADITLRVPEAPTLTALPVYDQFTELLRIESTCTTVPAVTIANGVDGSADAYIFSYNGGPQSVVLSGQCTGGTCMNVFTPPDPPESQYNVSVTARNVVGEGPPDTARLINAINNLLEVEVDVDTSTVQCTFLDGFPSTDRECQIEYSTREDLSDSVVEAGSRTSGNTITIDLTAPLERGTTYYYLVTATAEGVSVRVEGQTGCAVSELAKEVVVVDSAMNGNCMEGFARSVQIPAVLICFNGTVPGSIAIYLCECEEQYVLRLPGVGQDCQIIRTCQDNNTWSRIIPVVERVTLTAGLVLGIIGALLYVIIMITILVMAIVTFGVYAHLKPWLFAIVVVVWLILPPVGLALGLWLVRKKVEFVKKWCTITVLIMIVGNFLWFTNLAIWIAIAALFGPSSGDCRSVGILIAGVVVGVITGLYWIIVGPILHCNSSSDETDGPGSGKGKKSQDIPMESGGEYGKLQHGGTLTPPHTDPSADPMYAHLAAGKAEEGSAEEYSQLQRQKPPKAVANISDANYSHFEGDAPPVPPPPSSRPSLLPSQGQHKQQPPTVPPHTVADPDPPLPEVYSEVNQGLRYKTKQTSLTGL